MRMRIKLYEKLSFILNVKLKRRHSPLQDRLLLFYDTNLIEFSRLSSIYKNMNINYN